MLVNSLGKLYLLVLLHLHEDGLDLGEGVVVRPHHTPIVGQVVVDADVAGTVQHCRVASWELRITSCQLVENYLTD